jgi:hypothetical protein
LTNVRVLRLVQSAHGLAASSARSLLSHSGNLSRSSSLHIRYHHRHQPLPHFPPADSYVPDLSCQLPELSCGDPRTRPETPKLPAPGRWHVPESLRPLEEITPCHRPSGLRVVWLGPQLCPYSSSALSLPPAFPLQSVVRRSHTTRSGEGSRVVQRVRPFQSHSMTPLLRPLVRLGTISLLAPWKPITFQLLGNIGPTLSRRREDRFVPALAA